MKGTRRVATQSGHERQARDNERILGLLLASPAGPGQCEWAATVAFYKALHLVEALLAGDVQGPCFHTSSHDQRNDLLKRTKRYEFVYRQYKPLYDASMTARYLLDEADPFMSRYPLAFVAGTLVGKHLRGLESGIGRLLQDQTFAARVQGVADV